ncbi:Smr/MutS family protein [Hydrogenovibrio kuenenii]|uniref:Smr/MutS family protein n=1 Tax=Hydrogenovibrio kuenenii TaxID=63658 RepID=UPI000466C57C|nr:Smr/MutS family protein [Hydrogenovibrio kuenenii]
MKDITDEEKNLFAEAMNDVTPLQPTVEKISVEQQRQKPKFVRINRHPLEINSPKSELYETPAERVSAHESLFFQRYSMNKTDLKALKSGSFHYHWSIDLHGYSESEAEKQLLNFLEDARNNQQKHILVVHGKGYHSDTDAPILKNLVNQILRSWPHIIAFCSAKPKDGGTGATYVFLKLK